MQVVVESYNELQDSLSQVERLLFQHKLQETEKVHVCGVDSHKMYISPCTLHVASSPISSFSMRYTEKARKIVQCILQCHAHVHACVGIQVHYTCTWLNMGST